MVDALSTDTANPTPAPSTANEATTWAAFFTCAAVWGSTFLVISIGNDAMPPFWAAAIRLGLACVLLTAFTYARGRRWPSGAALRAAWLFGFLNFGLSFCLLYWGETHVASGLTAVVYGTIPLTTALFARAFGLEPLRPLKVAGALVAFVGVAFIFSGQLRANVPLMPLLAIFVAATCAAASGIALKMGPRQPPLAANAAGALIGFLVCLTASFLAREPKPIPTTSAQITPILYLTIMGSIGAFSLYAWLVNRWKLTRISFIAVIVPVIALILGVAFRGERVSAAAVAGIARVFTGLGLGIAADHVRR